MTDNNSKVKIKSKRKNKVKLSFEQYSYFLDNDDNVYRMSSIDNTMYELCYINGLLTWKECKINTPLICASITKILQVCRNRGISSSELYFLEN